MSKNLVSLHPKLKQSVMKKNQKTLTADSKLKSALDFMNMNYSLTDFTEWKSKDITNRFRIGGSFPSALKELGAIKTEYGKVMLTAKIQTLRPSTVRKKMNKMVAESIARTKDVVKTPKAPTKANTQNFDDVIIALRKQVMEDVVSELLSRIQK